MNLMQIIYQSFNKNLKICKNKIFKLRKHTNNNKYINKKTMKII